MPGALILYNALSLGGELASQHWIRLAASSNFATHLAACPDGLLSPRNINRTFIENSSWPFLEIENLL